MKQIYYSQLYYSKRMVLMHGLPRSSFRPGWAPSYLIGLRGPLLSPDNPLGDIDWTRRGLAMRWYMYKIGGYQLAKDPNVLILHIENLESKPVIMAFRVDL